MGNGKNIFFFFDTFIRMEEITEKSYVNALIEDNPKFEGKYHYIVAGAKAIKDTLESKNQNIDSIICASDMGEKNKSYLTEELNKIFGDTIRIEWIKYQNTDNSDTILSEIAKSYEFSQNDTLYLLTNSGVRNNIMFFSTFTQIMVAKGLKTELIYVPKAVRNKEETIRNVTNDNRYFEVLRAVELFVQSGNPKSLKKIYDKNKDLQKLLSYMDNFYKNIQICRPVNQSDILDIYDDMIDEIDGLMEKDIAIEIKLLLPTIKEKFQPLDTDDEESSFWQILKWCQNNDMLLTGYFIMDAEYKKFLYDKKIVQFIDNKFPSSDIIYRSQTRFDRRDSYLDDKDKYENLVKKKKMTSYDISNCLKFIFRRITNITLDKTLDKKFEYFIDLRNNNGYIKIRQSLEKLGIKPYNNDSQNKSLYELILLQDLIRNLRNNMAHSDNNGIIRGRYNIRVITDMILKKYQKKYPDRKTAQIYNGMYKANDYVQPTEDIIFDEEGVYDSLKIIFEVSIDIIKENIEIIKGKAK